jgi:outer membrane protein
MLKHLVFLLAVPTVLVAQEPTEARYISLDEAIRLAQLNSPAAIQARNTLRQQAMAVRGSYLDFLPTLNASVGLDRPLEREQGERIWRHSAQLSSSLNIFDPARFYAVGQAKLRLEQAEIGEITQRYNTALQVKQQFFNALNARETEAAARAALETSQQSFNATRARVRAGSAISADSLQAMISYQNATISLLSAQNSARQASAALTRLVGSETPVQADPADTANFAFVTIDSAALVAALDQSPGMQSQQIQVDLAQYGRKTARARYWPRLSGLSWSRGGSGLGFYGYDDLPFEYRKSYTTGVTISMPIWDNLNREDQLVQARLAAENAEVQFRDQRAAQQVQLAQLIGQLRTTQAQIEVQQLSLLAAEEALRVVTLRYQLGAATLLDVSTSQDQLNNARRSLISQRHAYRVARAQIEALIGRDLQ